MKMVWLYLALILTAISLSACIVYPVGRGGDWHHHRHHW